MGGRPARGGGLGWGGGGVWGSFCMLVMYAGLGGWGGSARACACVCKRAGTHMRTAAMYTRDYRHVMVCRDVPCLHVVLMCHVLVLLLVLMCRDVP